MAEKKSLEKIDDYRWRIPESLAPGMRVPGLVYANEKLLQAMEEEPLKQVVNVAHLPGIVNYSLAMPDIHWGYGFAIGGVAAVDIEDGVISPGGIGYDINCGVRMLRTNLREKDIKDKMRLLIETLFSRIPSGVGSRGKLKLNRREGAEVLHKGAQWMVERGYGTAEDIEFTEEKGRLAGADSTKVSQRAMERGAKQQGTLGSGNHFLEVQIVEEIYEPEIARVFGIEKGAITVMIHSGSRGLGYQVCDDYLRIIGGAVHKYGIELPDRQLACVPINSPEGKDYFAAMAAAANYAWANRQYLLHLTREIFANVFDATPGELGMGLIYDVAHNIGKFEEHTVGGTKKKLFIHRKGATRAFPPGHPELPVRYKACGQPVIIPGDMGRASYLLVGTEVAMTETFGSTCHGAGRVMSRTRAIKAAKGRAIHQEMEKKGVVVRTEGRNTLAEELPEAYKDINDVIDVVHQAGISRRVAKMKPLGVIKG
ncbi:RtcB family protein [candidate division NPL-UPA2 bacterium Unc8]|uniref:tRNA-splicing ligase RtcB n=1 Tax=candidate division NPL-UPA2 bacterium Unc8 TaxID=1980939 RepID=A0A399FX78_UNCN2|nr:RNA-splicing ligase RtcB [Bacillota bacterium]MBT9138763.1 RNA-splicing ligase RtcB [Bacillota bacterium]MBT9146535.1 RNA-splicing ligase RtcB [Bacillota bacterium]RIH99821.1 MAG: RtcB family protein [candidate division NPL-UPA2 bacterium Unc8]